MPLSKLKTIAASADRSASGSATFDLPSDSKALIVQLEVTAHSGTTPTLDVKLQDSVDGTNYNDVTGGGFTQVTTVDGRSVLRITAPFTSKLKAVWTLGGTTPHYTFSLKAIPVTE